ncbi:non-ribosomal peptide synthetase [Ketobacter sp.]|uniref:non-ribosomal peptide synthetase n=1 Tax=Ketobacter sp. TaxID=2083498 RepID=UPI000F15CE82|nr:non-ribosomal peptide synthetase [Ketobacter sp.]RLT93660.1 MAG: amino acid adenylation domain-containing protein [Ketobacter sp.]
MSMYNSHLNEFSRFPKVATEQSIATRFEQQVELHSDHMAVVDAKAALTYNELNRQANRIARTICARLDNQASQRVAIYLEKGTLNMAAILGVLKSGNTYVPVDPAFPESRNEYIFNDAQAALILTNTEHLGSAQAVSGDASVLVNLDTIDPTTDDSNLELNIDPDTLAYILYTSGSTGKPKGVMQNHRNVLHGCMRRSNLQSVTPEDRFTQLYSASVMGAVYCIYGALLNGASLYSYDIREQGLDNLAAWLVDNKITIYHSVASVFRQFAAENETSGADYAIRLVIFGGERVLTSDVHLARKVFGQHIHFFTGLGSTETGTIRHFKIDPETKLEGKVVPIGFPVDDVEVRLLGEDGAPVAVGEVGEITVRSPYIALGYWRNEEITRQVFETDPDQPDTRVYRTGDMGMMLENGLLLHKGRKDFQVKIRGFRIEIGEIETALLDHPCVEETVVVAKDVGQDTQLVAYLVLTPGDASESINVRILRQHLADRLPYYMIPAMFIRMESLPKTPNNKIDRNQLPDPSPENEIVTDQYVGPANECEQALVELCEALLKKEKLSTNQSFFEYGGDSLKATQLVSRINKRFGVKLSMRSVFDAIDLKQLAESIESAASESTDALPDLLPIPRADNQKLPTSYAQRRMWLVNQLQGGSASYNISNTVRLSGELNKRALEAALTEMVARHETLRTHFPHDDNGPYQVIRPPYPITLTTMDLSDLGSDEREQKLDELVHQSLSKVHHVERDALFECSLIKLGSEDHALVLIFNHIIYDNIWSSGIFFQELGLLYDAFAKQMAAGQPLNSPLQPLAIQFADFAAWEQQNSQSHSYREDLEYWKEQLANPPEPLQLPSDHRRPDKPTLKGGQVKFTIPASLRIALEYFARDESATMFMVLLAGWQLLLHRYTQQNDILVGTPTGRRNRIETEGLIGLFINNLVIRTDLSGNPSFKTLVSRVRKTTLDALSHDELPFERLVEELRPERKAGISPYFQHLFIHRNAKHTEWTIPGLTVTPVEAHPGGSKFDLTLSMLEEDHELSGTLEYSTDLFNQDTVARMADNYIQLLSSAMENAERPAWDMELLSVAERNMVFEQWNQTQQSYPDRQCTFELFQQQVERKPQATALISEAGTLSYEELNVRANQLAQHLIDLGAGPEKLVAVCLNRSAELVIALLGVMKAGAAYVPLDPDFPAERLVYMIEDSQAMVLITQPGVAEKLPACDATPVLLTPDSEIFDSPHTENPPVSVKPENLAYVIYTSGSTGKPKGVQLQHQSLVNFLCSMQVEPGITEHDILHSITTICFDIAALEIFLPLITGAQLVMKRREVSMSPTLLMESLNQHRATILQATPVTWRMLLEFGWTGEPKLKALCGGEAMGIDLAEKLIAVGCDVWNLYGPTETTIWSSVCNVKRKEDALILGHPIANTQLYICSDRQTLQPIGAPGELLIGGDGLARGYFNREDITREKFIPNPFLSGTRLYRTGDLAIRRANGDIEFLGRMDNQVKIRGFRIELGDIESHISEYPDIAHNVVIAREDTPGDVRLVAYMVGAGGAKIAVDQVREHIRNSLPDYMVPSAFIELESFPLTPNGKVDRKKLPAPQEQTKTTTATNYLSQSTVTSQLLKMFEDVLKTPVTSLQANFFDMGGHSLSALHLVAKINRQFALELPPTILFELQSVEKLSNAIVAITQAGDQSTYQDFSTLSDEDRKKVDDILAVFSGLPKTEPARAKGGFGMKESWLCKHLLSWMYKVAPGKLKGSIKFLILKLEGGSTFTVTMRKIFKEQYDIEVGDFTSLAFNVRHLRRTTKIGKYCSVFRTSLIQNADHPRNTLSTHGMFYHPQFGFTPGYELDRVQVEIGNDVWIGADAKILYPTKKIGDGAVIASGAVVVGDVPPYAIVGGYPAQVIRYRFSQETIEKLLEIKWWDYSIEELQSIRDEFMKPLEGDRIR